MTIKRSTLRAVAVSLDLSESFILESLRLVVNTIQELAPRAGDIAEKEALLRKLKEHMAHPDVLLNALEKDNVVTWCYGCIEGWRLNASPVKS